MAVSWYHPRALQRTPPSAPVPSGVASSVPEQRPGVCPNAPERSRAPQSTPSILFWTLYNVGPGGWGLFVAALSCGVVYQGCAAVLTERELDIYIRRFAHAAAPVITLVWIEGLALKIGAFNFELLSLDNFRACC